MKFGQIIVRKIIKIVATRCYILRLKCANIDFGWGSPRLPSWNKGDLLLTKGEWCREGKGKGRERKTGRMEGRKRELSGGEGTPCLSLNFP